MKDFLVLRIIAKLLIPYMLVFALYVQFHGDFGPGGGFQAGVIFAVAFILYALLYGIDIAIKVVPDWITRLYQTCHAKSEKRYLNQRKTATCKIGKLNLCKYHILHYFTIKIQLNTRQLI